ncbi:carboxymuconolactone decarboxylase family protein [Orenia marismortui]|uniref:carboxymuconolactone decarboxylase family protein n=1 Tax=Orenia marismortui TaxID=46469 RepID=UPI00036B5D35|nr:carboxymuconolactone decarboxylase family protein [Orenia marismortui]
MSQTSIITKDKVEKIKVEEATGIVKDILLDIKSKKGSVPNLFKTYAHKPQILRATWNKMSSVMKDDLLPKKLKKLAALRVSVLNKSEYCINAHYNGLKQIGYPSEVLDQVKAGAYELLTEVEARILNFVDKATNNYADLSKDDFDKLALKEEELLELIAVIDLFSGLNRFTAILEIEKD